jgi:hypothetical protein
VCGIIIKRRKTQKFGPYRAENRFMAPIILRKQKTVCHTPKSKEFRVGKKEEKAAKFIHKRFRSEKFFSSSSKKTINKKRESCSQKGMPLLSNYKRL